MRKYKTKFYMILIFTLFVTSFIAACNGPDPQAQAATAVESYLQALVARDLNQMISYSCGAWEEQAQVELQSFAAVVNIRLEDMDCQPGEKSGDYTLISCTGSIIADYGAEDLEIDLSERIFQTIQESGEWRMCGYH